MGVGKEMSADDVTKDIDDVMKNKQGLAIWIVANCKRAKERFDRVQEIYDAGLDIDRRGHCFPGSPLLPPKPPSLLHDVIKSFKFYLSFENTWHCRDYITEKLYSNGFESHSVPIVWGATKEDYLKRVPAGSFIFADDYTPDELVKYITYLDNNNTAYRQFFNWRYLPAQDVPDHNRTCNLCQLCRIINGINIDNLYNPNSMDLPLFYTPPTVIRNVASIRKYWYQDESRECLPTYTADNNN